ncbi:hypothetical protein GCM10027600_37000 [Nocardioides ginsengisegetis]
MLAEAGYEILVEGVEREGSVFREWAIRRAKKKARLFAEATAMALSDTYLRKPGSDATAALAASVSTVLSTAGDRKCLHHFDNIVIGQFRDSTGELVQFSKELNPQERRAVNRDSSILDDPSSFHVRLSTATAALSPPVDA